jgi:hypothetical protein
MALVGEAHIIVRAITTGVAGDIKKGFNNIDDSVGRRAGRDLGRSFFRGFNDSGSGNIFGRISDGLQSLAPDADAARESFRGLVKGGYYLQGIIGPLVGGIASVVGGLVALAGSAGAAAPSIVSLANIMIGLKIGMGVAKFALGGVSEAVQQATQLTKQYGSVAAAVGQQMKQLAFDAEAAALAERRAGLSLEQARENLLAAQQLPPNSRARREAELAYEEADLAYRRAQEQQEAADKAKKKGASGAGGVDPFADLTPSQKTFAQFLLGIQDQFKILKEAAASGFLPILQTQIQRLNTTYFPVLIDAFKKIGISVGNATESITDMFVKAENVERVKTLFNDSAVIIEKLGDLLAELFEGFLIVLNAASPQAERFLNFLIDKMTEFNDYLKTIDLKGFFERSGDIAADFGKIFGNTFDAIGGIIEANFGPDSGGQMILDWLKDVTGKWAALNETVEGKNSLKKYFQDVSKNAIIIFQTVGVFFEQLKGIGADPAVGETFKILQGAAPYLGDIIKASVEAGPSFANFVVEIARFIKLVTDSEAPKIFFETLTDLLKKLNDFLGTEFGQDALKITGRILAWTLALGVAFKAVGFFAKVVIGNVRAILKPISKVFEFFKKAPKQIQIYTRAFKVFGSIGKLVKLGGILTVVAGLVFRFIELVNTSQDFRDMLSKLGGTIGDAFGRLGESLGKLWETIMKLFGIGTGEGGGDGGLMGILNGIMDLILYIIVPAIAGVITTIVNAVTLAINLITSVIGAFAPGLNQLFQGILDLFSGKFGPGMARIFGSIAILLLGIVQMVINGFIDILNFFIVQFVDTVRTLDSIPFVSDILKGLGLDVGKFNIEAIGKVTWAEDASANLDKSIAKMADGGTVYPRTGGSIVNVAEAGRPERIEPLDANGLSQRDKALISEMSSSGVIVNMTVNAPPGMDVKELTAEVSRRLAFTMRRGGVTA